MCVLFFCFVLACHTTTLASFDKKNFDIHVWVQFVMCQEVVQHVLPCMCPMASESFCDKLYPLSVSQFLDQEMISPTLLADIISWQRNVRGYHFLAKK